MNRKFKIDLLGSILCVVLPGLIIWSRPQWVGLSAEQRGPAIAVLCIVFVVLLLAFSFSDSSRPAIAWRAVKQWARDRGLLDRSTSAGAQPDDARSRAAALKQLLADRHFWRWRYRERWVLVAGDVPLVKRLAPGLVEAGYLITGDAVLLYAQQTRDTL
ncbi:type VI secretion protein VasK, partial [Burkholderia glumae]|nr:type VI secretion protein VasK [Burkholderia glumae]MCM2494355.1 type VI secretion protein VasK [Burkholderia glumae]MCM2539461.1 type VI secretion protein VasK [Burkholderia glumae]MCM2545303.1 type VI secretion protein VasK [Burkholderia glumae]